MPARRRNNRAGKRARRTQAQKKIIFMLVLLIFVSFYGYKYIAARNEENAITALSWVVANRLIVIDPGHGGTDPGALGSTGVHEKDITLSVSKKLADMLDEAGAQVILTRESDQEPSIQEGGADSFIQSQDLTYRAEIANKNNADIFISIHVNSFIDPRESGAQTFYQPTSEEGKKLARSVQSELNKHLANPGREEKPADYFVNKTTKMPSIITEIGFITNPQEEKLLLEQQYQKKIVWAIYTGIIRYFALA